MDDHKQTRIAEIMDQYKEITTNTREALRLLNLPESLIASYTINIPDFDVLLPEDVVKFFLDVRILVTLHLDGLKFSEREIVRRIGGSSLSVVHKILQKYRKLPSTVNPEEVSRSLPVPQNS